MKEEVGVGGRGGGAKRWQGDRLLVMMILPNTICQKYIMNIIKLIKKKKKQK